MNAMRLELMSKKINVTVIHPGFIKTDIAPHMDKYPFVIEADVAAQQMIRAIEAKKPMSLCLICRGKPLKV
jgi:short-subunit dehydrogenase